MDRLNRLQQGVIRHFNHTIQKSYPALRDLADQMFPQYDDEHASEVKSRSRHGAQAQVDEQFNDFNYWRRPLPAIEWSDEDDDVRP